MAKSYVDHVISPYGKNGKKWLKSPFWSKKWLRMLCEFIHKWHDYEKFFECFVTWFGFKNWIWKVRHAEITWYCWAQSFSFTVVNHVTKIYPVFKGFSGLWNFSDLEFCVKSLRYGINLSRLNARFAEILNFIYKF